jgi:uncharacterized protein YydD (DUF2326 family)
MLRRLAADYPGFKNFEFRPGMNIIAAERTVASQSTDSRNGTGKTSLIEVLHFLFGAKASGHVCSRPAFNSATFGITLDWPIPGGELTAERKGGENRVRTTPSLATQTGFLPRAAETISLDRWKSAMKSRLYAQSTEIDGITVRTLLSYAIRREREGGFHDPLRYSTASIKATVFSTHLAYLLGLDAKLIDEYRALAEKRSSTTALKKALKGLDLGEIVGDQARLEGKARLLEHEIEQLEAQIARFEVIPEFERLKARADEITSQIDQLSRQDEVDTRNEADIRDSLERERLPSDDYLATAFTELGVALPNEVKRRYDDVERFHRVIAENRHRFLKDELRETEARLRRRREERRELDDERAGIMRRLHQGGALDGLQLLQHSLASKEAQLLALKEQTTLLERIRSIEDEVSMDLLDLKQRVHADLRARESYIAEASHLFTDFARRIYSSDREAYLTIKEGDRNLLIDPHIQNQDSNGIGNMRMLCFDLVCAVMAHRGGRGPDFLVHDGRIYDGVDERQVASGLQLAAEVAEAEGMQYIVPINSDVLGKARDCDFNPDPYILQPTLTDADEAGGLFGFRFD